MPFQRLFPGLIPALSLCLCLAGISPAFAAPVSYAVSESVYSQDFNTLINVNDTTAPWSDGVTLAGWYFRNEGGAVPIDYRAWDGSAARQNQVLSLGSPASSDRALGGQNQNTPVKTMRYGMALTNNTGETLTQFSLTYTGEQWRVISGETIADRLEFSYGVFSSGTGTLTAAGYVNETSLDFVAPRVNIGGSQGLNGNLAENRDAISFTVTGLNWAAGEDLWLRWTDNNSVSPEQRSAMGIDDVSFTASPVPEPSTWLLLGMVGAGGWVLRRRKATSGG